MPMHLTAAERKARLKENPASAAAIAEARAYIAAAHLTEPQFARMIGYAPTSIHHWFAGTYFEVAGTDKNLVKAARLFIEANPVAPSEGNQGRFYETDNVATMRTWFAHCMGIEEGRGEMVCVYAGPGGQKTYIAEHLIAEWNRDQLLANPDAAAARHRAFYVYCSQDISPSQLVVKMLRAAGLGVAGVLQNNLATLRFHLRGARTVFVFDEAQHLSVPCLEIVRELNDLRPYFGVMVLGSHKLRTMLDTHAGAMEQWHSRQETAIELPGITEAKAIEIVQGELGGAVQPEKAHGLIQSCMVADIYSQTKRQYLSARKLFKTLKAIRKAAAPLAHAHPTGAATREKAAVV